MKVKYTVSWGKSSSHLLDIEMCIEGNTFPQVAVAMPAWVPGSYEILDSARHVQEFEAFSSSGKLPWKRLDKQTWSIEAENIKTVMVRYRVYANTVNCTASSFDSTHIHITGGTVFLYLVNHLHLPHSLVLQKPHANWKIATGLEKTRDPLCFTAKNYDELIDCPIEIGPFHHLSFKVGGKKHHLVVHDYGHEEKNLQRLANDCEKLVRSFYKLFGEFPYDEYWFLCHFHPTIAKGGGLEHHNSTHISLPQFLDSEDEKDYDRILEFASHEFFHLWNVKRLRPEGLGPFDYSKEVYTPNLWIAEGITEYYGELAMRRSGIWSDEKFFEALSKMIDRLNDMPGESLMSLKDASFTTWTNAPWHRYRAPDDVNLLNSYVDYYTKGALVGWLLDLQIRIATKGKKSLDDVMRALWLRYGKNDEPYPEKAVEQAVEELAGKSVRSWLEREVSGPKRIEYREILSKVGLKFSQVLQSKKDWEKEKRKIAPSLGVEMEEKAEGLRVLNVFPESAAEKAGIDRDDILIAMDTERLTSANWRSLILRKSRTKQIEISLFRHHRLISCRLRPDPHRRMVAKLELEKGSSPKSKLARAWLVK